MGRGLATRSFTGYVYVSLEDTGKPAQAPHRCRAGFLPLLASAPAQIVSLDTAINQMNQTVQAVGGLLQATLDPATVAA